MTPAISIIVNTKNEAKNIKNCLNSILKQNFNEKIEIIVIDNNSTDNTKKLAAEFTDQIYNFGPERSAQKNFGAMKARGNYLLFLDADMTLSVNLISEAIQKFEKNKKLVALYVPEKILAKGFFNKIRNFERGFYENTVIDAVRIIKKDAFLKINGFDEKLIAAEDWDLDKRLKKIGPTDIIISPLYHNEKELNLKKILAKKKYYSSSIKYYIFKWGENDPDIKKQLGFTYRYLTVFTENKKWKKIIRHPILFLSILFLKILIGLTYLINKK